MAKQKANEDEAFEAWQAEIRARIPEEKRAHLDALLGEEGSKELFKGGLREADYYRRLNDLHEEKEKLNTEGKSFQERVAAQERWYNEANEEYKRVVAGKTSSVPDATGNDRSFNGVDSAVIEELRQKHQLVQQFDQALPKFVGQAASIAVRAAKEGFEIDPMEVIEYAASQRVDPLTAYSQLTADERETRAAKQREKELADAMEQGRREERSRLQSPDRVRYPSADAGPSAALFGDKTPDLSNRNVREKAAMEDWYKMQQGGSS